jgi:hypothetical protein
MSQYKLTIYITVRDEARSLAAATERGRAQLDEPGFEATDIEEAITWLVVPDEHPAGLEIDDSHVEAVRL